MSSNDEKRNRKIELSREAEVLKKMRELRSMSVRNVGDMLNVSFTTVSHMENGRATIHDEYLNKFLEALEFSRADFKEFMGGRLKDEALRLKCLQLVEKMEPSKLEKVFAVLSVLSIGFLVLN
jgi:transcriptional regulator with XRE-family HTH domain